MKLKIKLLKGQIVPLSDEDREALGKLKDAVYEVDIKNMDMRTIKQNSAMHKYFALLSQKFNEGGLSIVKVLKVDVEWTPDSIKDLLWRPIQESQTGKKSTTKLNRTEITKVYDVLNRALGEKLGIHVPFPKKDLD